MKFNLPEKHGLSEQTSANLVFSNEHGISLTDIQFAALEAGVGRGSSALVVSPTSTGKTLIALWAIANGIEQGCRTVYLLTHRALAKQKFTDFSTQLLNSHLGGDPSSLVIATGDSVETVDGSVPRDPLQAPVIVATYEKYLALLSASGVPKDMGTTVVVCDEIQLIGDENRGQNVEILLALMKNAGWRQFVGLSAVLQSKDADELANWLGVQVIREPKREKELRYECWTSNKLISVETSNPEVISESPLPTNAAISPLAALKILLNGQNKPTPIIVFCSSKPETYKLASRYYSELTKGSGGQLSLAFDTLPSTAANSLLAQYLPFRFAVHSADLMDEERSIVEQHLLDNKLDVVFATTTLAAGVNFPLGAAIIIWERWNVDRRTPEPIPADEFHNMAGRVGRMGFDHEHGRVVFLAESDQKIRASRSYLELGSLPDLQSRVTPAKFDQLALQLVATGLCASRSEVDSLVKSTLSGLREEDRNTSAFAKWSTFLTESLDYLLREGLLLEMQSGRLVATQVGKAIAHSGLLPETGCVLIQHAVRQATRLVSYLPTNNIPGDPAKLAFLVLSACLSTPEFRGGPRNRKTRYLPWQLDKAILFSAEAYKDELLEPVWNADISPINAAKLTLDWINGGELRDLEKSFDSLSAGGLRDMFRNVTWVLQGFASIIEAASDTRVEGTTKPPCLIGDKVDHRAMRMLPRYIRRLSYRVAEGLHENVVWMTWLNTSATSFRLSRTEILGLRLRGYTQLEQLMLGSPEAEKIRDDVFSKALPSAKAKSNWLRDISREWKKQQRQRAADKHIIRARKCANSSRVETYYAARGTDFEKIFEDILNLLNVEFQKLDVKTTTGAPDYLILFKDCPPLIVELKSKLNEKLVDYNSAVEVLSASEVHGYKDLFCVTLCHPGVDPSVPEIILACGRLSVVESQDLGEALLRLCEGGITQTQIWQWLSTPGQALASDLPYREFY